MTKPYQLVLLLLLSLPAFGADACPASSPLAGNNTCFYIAGNGSDTNPGTKASPWAHSPGMPACSGNCAKEQTTLGGGNNNGGQSHPGVGFIFRGGDTWHFSNSSPSDGMPYTGGVMYSLWGSNTNCVYEGNQTGCFYWGVDTTWYNSSVCRGSFCRPIFNGDNPTSTSIVSSCPYPTRTINRLDRTNSNNVLFFMANDTQGGVYVDSIEFTGLCSDDVADSGHNANNDAELIDSSDLGPVENFLVNVYFHGWTVTGNETAEGKVKIDSTGFQVTWVSGSQFPRGMTGISINASRYNIASWNSPTWVTLSTLTPASQNLTNADYAVNSTPNCFAIGGGSVRDMDHVVIDGADSDGQVCAAFQWPRIMHMKNSYVSYAVNINTGWYHDVHDNIIEHWAGGKPITHGNFWENNGDYAASGTANVWYNNIMRHNDPSFSTQGYVGLWFCPNTTPAYWFNNIQYDFVQNPAASEWSVVGPPTYGGCVNIGTETFFNNTIVDSRVDCPGTNNLRTNAQYEYAYNNLLINSGFIPNTGVYCNGYNSTTNVALSDATATRQGYTTGTAGLSAANSCANDTTKPCKPTAVINGSVGAGANHQDYCTALAAYTGDPSISTDAYNACKKGTTYAISYNTTTHTTSYPAQTAVTRPASGAWDAGADQFTSPGP